MSATKSKVRTVIDLLKDAGYSLTDYSEDSPSYEERVVKCYYSIPWRVF
jgi:monomeric isocitrate dehydrogenase